MYFRMVHGLNVLPAYKRTVCLTIPTHADQAFMELQIIVDNPLTLQNSIPPRDPFYLIQYLNNCQYINITHNVGCLQM